MGIAASPRPGVAAVREIDERVNAFLSDRWKATGRTVIDATYVKGRRPADRLQGRDNRRRP